MSTSGYYYTEAGDLELILTEGQARHYPRHVHMRHWTVGIVRKGSVILTTDGPACRFCAGQQFIVRPHEPHSLNVESGSSLLALCFDGSIVFSKNGIWDGLPRLPFLQPNERAPIGRAITACREEPFLHGTAENPSFPRNSVLIHAVREVMQLIMKDPTEDLPVERMASYAGYSRWYFLRIFQKIAGMTPHAFQLLCRLRLARSMLRANASGSAAAASAGFFDQSHMHRMFRRHHGMTPQEFKKASVKLEL